jgi:pimeloyl-ACP methyl ester carboxylesterase
MQLSFKKFGTGEKKIIAFHGFGQDANLFSGWENYFSEHTIYSIDLYFHGESRFPFEKPELSPQQWREIFSAFLTEHKIGNFSLLAFSLGGRVALTTLHFFYESVESVVLLAPDGIKKNFWYLFSTRLRTMRLLFRFSVDNPSIFDNFKSFLKKFNSNKSLIKLAENQMSDRHLRKRVYLTWLTYRYFLLRKKRISALLNENKIPFTLIAAKYDRLVPVFALENFVKFVPHARFEVISCGHFKLPEESLKFLLNSTEKINK